MILNRLMADSQGSGNLFIAHPLDYTRKYFHFAIRKRMKGAAGFAVNMSGFFHLIIQPVFKFTLGKNPPFNNNFAFDDFPDGLD